VRELNEPRSDAPAWDEFEWRAAMAVSVMHGISGLLATRLQWRGPAVWNEFLADQLRQGQLREQRVRSLLAKLDAAARQAGVPLMVLKGSAMLDMGLYAPGVRPQSDIDLLCRPEDEARAVRVIESLGYEACAATWKHVEFQPIGLSPGRAFGEHIDNPHKIELHVRLLERLLHRETKLELHMQHLRPGLNNYAEPLDLLRHLMLHASGNLSNRGARLIQVHDVALLCRHLGRIEPSALLADAWADWWKWPLLDLSERCFPGNVDVDLRAQAASRCPWWLRRWSAKRAVEDLSLVDLRHPAMPTLAWNRDVPSFAKYIWRRIVPERNSLPVHIPVVAGVSSTPEQRWEARPRWRRVVRWLFTRPPRAVTMYALRTACSYSTSAER